MALIMYLRQEEDGTIHESELIGLSLILAARAVKEYYAHLLRRQ